MSEITSLTTTPSTRFLVVDAHEIPAVTRIIGPFSKAPLLEGTLSVVDALTIPRVGGGAWLAQVLGFEFGSTVDTVSEAGRTLGVAVWGVAHARGTVASSCRRFGASPPAASTTSWPAAPRSAPLASYR
jgi:hypothetical protein